MTGVVGVLLHGARHSDLDIEAELDALQDAGFWISDELRQEVVTAAEEEP